MTNTPDRHAFRPSRPGGTVCVAMRQLEALNLPGGGHIAHGELCGYPASHPIHGPLQLDTSPRAAPLRTDAEDLRANLWALVAHVQRTVPGDPLLIARVDEIVQRWGSERPATP